MESSEAARLRASQPRHPQNGSCCSTHILQDQALTHRSGPSASRLLANISWARCPLQLVSHTRQSTRRLLGTNLEILANPTQPADNTNADPETRAAWTALAKELNVPIRCVHFLSPPELCRHNDAVRAANKELVGVCLVLSRSSRVLTRRRTPNPDSLCRASRSVTLDVASGNRLWTRALRISPLSSSSSGVPRRRKMSGASTGSEGQACPYMTLSWLLTLIPSRVKPQVLLPNECKGESRSTGHLSREHM